MQKDDNSVELVYTVTKEVVLSQQTQKNALETKASTLIAFAGGMFALLMGARETIILLPVVSQLLTIVSISFFALSVLLANVVVWVRRYRVDPDPEALATKYLNIPVEETQLQLISNLVGTWKSNNTTIENKANYLRLVFLSQAVAFVLLGIALLISINR